MPKRKNNTRSTAIIRTTMLFKALISSSSSYMTGLATTKTPLFYNKRFILSSLSSSSTNNNNVNINIINSTTATAATPTLNILNGGVGITSSDGMSMIQEIEIGTSGNANNNNASSIAFEAVVTATATSAASTNTNNDENNDNLSQLLPDECLKHDHYNGSQTSQRNNCILLFSSYTETQLQKGMNEIHALAEIDQRSIRNSCNSNNVILNATAKECTPTQCRKKPKT